MNIYVGNLSWSMSDDDLSNLFTQFGSVSSAKILKDKVSGRSKGFGFVEMENDEEANNAIANLNETEVQGRKIIVNQSQPRPAGEGGRGPTLSAFSAVETVAVVVMAVETVVAMAAVENQGIINHVIPYKHKSLSNERLFLCVWFK